MSNVTVTMLELRVIESVLQMGSGYVLDFTDRQFTAFFSEHGVDIDHERYRAEGTSKAKRLRCFLRSTPPPLTGQVLAGLLLHRLASVPDGVTKNDREGYCRTVERLGGQLPSDVAKAAEGAKTSGETEADLLKRVFRPDIFAKLPIDAAMSALLVDRMGEAHRCIESGAHLAAVILCGSVLEGMCLGFGTRHPERSNRGYAAHYSKPPPKFHEWRLKEWIEVLGHLGDLSPNIEKFGQALRDFRNYVHPAEQLANGFLPDPHTSRIAFQVVVAAADDLARATPAPAE